MHHKPLLSLICMFIFAGAAFAADPDFVVAPRGDDAASGKLDAPFATLQRAQAAVRQLRAAQPDRKTPIVVALRGGTYTLTQPLQFTSADSGTADSPTVYTAYSDERPLISGGIQLTGFKTDDKGRWVVQIPEVKEGKWDFMQLWVNGHRRYRPRLPQAGWLNIADKVDAKPNAKGFDSFKFKPGDINPNWANLADVQILPAHIWTMSRFHIKNIDVEQSIVTFTGLTRTTQWYGGMPKNGRYLVENVKEALGQPGQWYLDRPTGILTYIPMPGETLANSTVVAPKAEFLVQIQGDPASRKFVSHLHLKKLDFAHTNWNSPPEGNSYPQAEVHLKGAIFAAGAHHCIVEDCTIRSVATYAIEFERACKNNRIERCELTDMGAGGIKIGPLRLDTDAELQTSHNIVRDCLIAHGGRLHSAACGVVVGHADNTLVEHNEIADFYYTGVSLGWSWGYGPSGAHHNTIANNHIHHLGQGVLSDMGGIYTLGAGRGSVLHHNFIHDVDAFDYGGWGIYYDEGTSDMLAENNVVCRVKTGGFHQHYGKENFFRNNIIAFSRKDQVQRTRPEPHLSFTFERNIIIFSQGQLLGLNWTGENYKMDNNIYWRSDGKAFDFAKMTFEQWQAKGQDRNSLIADPMFVDPENGNFALKPGSPAGKTGFKPIDVSKAGRLTNNTGPAGVKLAPAAFPVMEGR